MSLILHGLPRDIQKQVQARNPKSIEILLQSLQDISSNFMDRSLPPRAIAIMTPSDMHPQRNVQLDGVAQCYGTK